MEKFISLVVVAMATVCVTNVECCMCSKRTQYDQLCQSDFVIIAQVLSEERDYPEGSSRNPWDYYRAVFTLDIQAVVRSKKDVSEIPNILESVGPASICGITLEVDSTYLLTGMYMTSLKTGKPILDMTMCNFHANVNGEDISEVASNVMNNVNCDRPRPMPGVFDFRRFSKKAEKAEIGEQNFLSGLKRREVVDGVKSFLSTVKKMLRRK